MAILDPGSWVPARQDHRPHSAAQRCGAARRHVMAELPVPAAALQDFIELSDSESMLEMMQLPFYILSPNFLVETRE